MSFLNLMRNRLKPKEVNAALSDIKNKIDTNTAYTPPAYSSTEEVNTGRKWVDGRDIYCKVYQGVFPVISQAATVTVIENFNDDPVYFHSIINTPDSSSLGYDRFAVGKTTNNIRLINVSTAFSEGTYLIMAYYCKVPVPGANEETKATKRTKKTTK